jgi:hypothetical protein
MNRNRAGPKLVHANWQVAGPLTRANGSQREPDLL